ncbi:MAG: ATP-binding protein, partial [Elusimicrobia bacterium]|nr:ATP-binding protein [Elusimicrobiota bacterium]
MPAIYRLSQEVASQIAAGEVVERPASILKELLENSLDAGAAKIQVESSGAGRKLLHVVDDGKGMDSEDCRLACERHATRNIRAIEDVARLSTCGCRG